MIFGKMPERKKYKKKQIQPCFYRRLNAFLFFSIGCLFLSNHSYADELETLLLPFTKIQSIIIPFHEKRNSIFLKRSKESSGLIEYSRPDKFVKEVFSPVWKKIIIEGEQLTLLLRTSARTSARTSDANQSAQIEKKIISLDDFPQFKQFQALFSGLLQGDAKKLTQYYRYEIKKISDNETQLILQSHAADNFIQEQQIVSQRIEIIFTDNNDKMLHIKRITKTGFGGERTLYTFSSPDNVIRDSE